jgi:hypothetical protein
MIFVDPTTAPHREFAAVCIQNEPLFCNNNSAKRRENNIFITKVLKCVVCCQWRNVLVWVGELK